MVSEFNIEVVCLFCKAPLQSDENKNYASGDMIKCNACGELNDYDSVVEVAKEAGIKKIEAEINKTIKTLFK